MSLQADSICRNLILFQATPTPTGVSIPYPTIALHATLKYQSTTDALLLNISLNDAETVNDFDDISILELTILPPNGQAECIKDIFTAMNTCADLHPDPDEDGEEGEEDSTAPGATGWITAENMDDYLDEEGNFKGLVYGEELGPGAGTVRTRDDGDEETRNGANGIDGEAHEEKYQRTG
jgi:nucleotide-sensitive chloride channel 1A